MDMKGSLNRYHLELSRSASWPPLIINAAVVVFTNSTWVPNSTDRFELSPLYAAGAVGLIFVGDGTQQVLRSPGFLTVHHLQTYIGGTPPDVGFARIGSLKNAFGTLKNIFNNAKQGKELFNFSAKAAEHMANPGRAVPVQILEQAIKGSKGLADPRGSRALMYTAEMFKNGKAYNLEVLYDKATNSIWHFQYRPIKP